MRELTLGQFRAKTAALPDDATIVLNVDRGSEQLPKIVDRVYVDVSSSTVTPFFEIILCGELDDFFDTE
jgi:hypothetical protein